MLEEISKYFKQKTQQYKSNQHQLISDYKHELEVTKDYNGRQLLELLQNCDDEGSDVVQIELDRENRTLKVSNNGSSFTLNGYLSLLYPNLSSKRSKRKYIGNKGLGFRSILNWSTKIDIYSGDTIVTFSEDVRRRYFSQLYSKQEQISLIEQFELKKDLVPVPFLSCPTIAPRKESKFVTEIKIQYRREFENDIIKQARSITPFTLLFLRSIKSIKFVGFSNDIQDIISEKENLNTPQNSIAPSESIVFGDYHFHVFEKEEQLDSINQNSTTEEKEFYQIKLAFETGGKKVDESVYNFFPTKIKLKQPFVLHATFDLDASRNQIVDSRKNKIILKAVTSFIIDVAKYYTQQEVSYLPLNILHHNHISDTLESLSYYEYISKAIHSEEIFPCIDNTYRRLDDVIYVSQSFAQLLLELDSANEIPFHLIPIDSKDELNDWIEEVDDSLEYVGELHNVLNNVSAKTMSFTQRSWFVKEIITHCQHIKNSGDNLLNLLTDQNNNLIKGSTHTFTPVTKGKRLKIPSYTNITFLHPDLYTSLIESLEDPEDPQLNKSRFIYSELTGFCNLHSYEPATVAKKIISETRSVIKSIDSPNSQLNYLKEMNECLFDNYIQLEEGTVLDEATKVPCLNSLNEVIDSNLLILSDHYPSGAINKEIYEEIVKPKHYVASPIELGLDGGQDQKLVEDYLLVRLQRKLNFLS